MLRFHALKLIAVVPETPTAFTLKFENPDPQTFQYKPGQYLTLRVMVNGRDERRAFSLSSCPTTDAHLSVTIKAIENGVVSQHLKATAQAGHTLEVMPPMGNFFINLDANASRHHVLVGAGSGITPLMSMLKSVLAHERNSRITLLYGNRSQSEIIFRAALEELQLQYSDRLKVVHVLSRPEPGWAGLTGRLEGTTLAQLLAEAAAATPLPTFYYLCGPEAMMHSAGQLLQQRNVPAQNILREWYSAPVAQEGATAGPATAGPKGAATTTGDVYEIRPQRVTIKLDGSTYQVDVHPTEYILDAAINAGVDPPYACQEGVCCTCRAKLHKGLVAMDEREGLSDDELKNGYILTCQSHPLTDDVVLEYA
jgi:ring-1,2-phenylacetyl-CoA epoxidase subunit PaaE